MSSSCELLVIGGSAGSLDILLNVLPELMPGLPFAIVVVLHRKSSSTSALTDLFSSKTSIPVAEVEEKDPIVPSHLYIAPADYHLMIENNKTFSLDSSEKINYSRPSIDLTLETAAEAYADKLTCLLLSGANTDGAEGLLAVKQYGGMITIQDPGDAKVPLMPQNAIMTVKPDRILKNSEIAGFINSLR